MTYAPNVYSLVADIGGTNTRVALAEGPRVLEDTIRRYPNAEHPGLETVLRTFIDEMDGVDCVGACVAVAGPVRDGVGELTNLDWSIDKATLARATQAEVVSILNDLQAQGHAIDQLSDDSLLPVIEGPAHDPSAAKLVINVGTGFNVAPVYNAGSGRIVPPSEAGHANLPIRTEAELRLCQYVSTVHGFPAVEDVLSGRGLTRVYTWLRHEAGDPMELPGKEIMARCARGDDPYATEAVRMFVSLFGTVSGNLSLIHLPFGGVYLVGGVVRALGAELNTHGFAEAFRDKGRFAGFMGNFAVSIIEDDYAALRGSAAHLVALGAGG